MRIVEALLQSYPAAIAFVAWLLRKPLGAALDRLKSAKIGPTGVAFNDATLQRVALSGGEEAALLAPGLEAPVDEAGPGEANQDSASASAEAKWSCPALVDG